MRIVWPRAQMGDYEFFDFQRRKRRQRAGLRRQAGEFRSRQEIPGSFHHPWRPAGCDDERVPLSLESADVCGSGFAVVTVNFHGSTGYGQAFTDEISGDWGGKPLEDLQKGWAAALQKYTFLDGNRACALGASVRRLHGLLDRRQLAAAVEVPRRSRRRVRHAHDGATRPKNCGSTNGRTAARSGSIRKITRSSIRSIT